MLAAEIATLSGAVREGFGARPGSRPGPARRPADLFFPRPAPGIRYTIGRDSACDLLIEDLSVSRWHARLEHAAGRWILTDLGSTNGTRLNGWRVRDPVPVQAGDRVGFGSAEFVICADRRDGQAPPAGRMLAGPGSG